MHPSGFLRSRELCSEHREFILSLAQQLNLRSGSTWHSHVFMYERDLGSLINYINENFE
jgi:hypothetical protein